MNEATATALEEIALEIVDRAEREHRELSDFEAGRVDAFLDIAQIVGLAAELQVLSKGT